MTQERVALLRSRYSSPARWARELEIEYEALEGSLLYPEFTTQYNVCEPFDVTDVWRWTIWMGADPHMRTKHAFCWRAFNSDGDSVVCGEFWPAHVAESLSVREYAEAIEWIESDSEDKLPNWRWANGKKLDVKYRYMDTHGLAANSDEGVDFFEAYRGRGLFFQPATKGHAALAFARDAIGALMKPVPVTMPDGSEKQRARFKVFRTCPELISEYQNVRYPEGDAERAADERPMTYRKHVLDACHYIETAHPGFVLPKHPHGSTFVPIYPNLGR